MRDAEKEEDRKGEGQEMRDSGKELLRKGGIQERWYAGLEG